MPGLSGLVEFVPKPRQTNSTPTIVATTRTPIPTFGTLSSLTSNPPPRSPTNRRRPPKTKETSSMVIKHTPDHRVHSFCQIGECFTLNLLEARMWLTVITDRPGRLPEESSKFCLGMRGDLSIWIERQLLG